jgi:phage terminase large subunit-like protein
LVTTPGSFKLTPDQVCANGLLGSAARHIMLYGGSRSGKTFLIVRAIVTRALAHKSRHACLRYRFNHIKASIVYDTLPKVMALCFPGVAAHSRLDRSDWFYTLPNGSEIWFGGLDDKERTEKIFGQEYASLFLNECSQIPFSSRNMALTRLAQNTPLRLKAYYDCNPPAETHWTCRVFIEKSDPDARRALRNGEDYAAMLMNPEGNRDNLPADYLRELEAMPERMRRRFWLGQFQSATENALWSYELLDRNRVVDAANPPPDMQRIVIAVDPSGASGEEGERSDEIGIVVVGLGADGRGYLIEDLSGAFGPAEWGRIIVTAFERHDADVVVAETNYGGAMVGEIIRAARTRDNARSIPFKEVKASRGKVVRAEPIATLYEQNKVSHVGYFERLEEQLCSMTTSGYRGDRSPDRADALIWALHEIFPAVVRAETKANRGPLVVNLGHAAIKQRLRG